MWQDQGANENAWASKTLYQNALSRRWSHKHLQAEVIQTWCSWSDKRITLKSVFKYWTCSLSKTHISVSFKTPRPSPVLAIGVMTSGLNRQSPALGERSWGLLWAPLTVAARPPPLPPSHLFPFPIFLSRDCLLKIPFELSLWGIWKQLKKTSAPGCYLIDASGWLDTKFTEVKQHSETLPC